MMITIFTLSELSQDDRMTVKSQQNKTINYILQTILEGAKKKSK